eukprot:Lankesteria_metandrocarpae@DN3587_c0_g1_i5.p2
MMYSVEAMEEGRRQREILSILKPTVSPLFIRAQCLPTHGRPEIGSTGTWVVSSAKPGNGIRQLRDGSLHTVWQSDGMGPHTVTVHFARRTRICRIELFLDQTIDESYTPSVVAVKVGDSEGDLELVSHTRLDEPRGWQAIDLGCRIDPTLTDAGKKLAPISTADRKGDCDRSRIRRTVNVPVATNMYPPAQPPLLEDAFSRIRFGGTGAELLDSLRSVGTQSSNAHTDGIGVQPPPRESSMSSPTTSTDTMGSYSAAAALSSIMRGAPSTRGTGSTGGAVGDTTDGSSSAGGGDVTAGAGGGDVTAGAGGGDVTAGAGGGGVKVGHGKVRTKLNDLPRWLEEEAENILKISDQANSLRTQNDGTGGIDSVTDTSTEGISLVDAGSSNGSNSAAAYWAGSVEGFCVQVLILQNYQQGQDCHIRQIRMLGHSATAQRQSSWAAVSD